MKTHQDLKSLIEKQIEFLEEAGAEIQVWTISEPASEAEIASVETELGFPIPPKLRQLYGSFAASIEFDWVHLDEDLEDHDHFVSKGGVNWNLFRLKTDLGHAKVWGANDPETEWGEIWDTVLPVVDVGCGDFIGVSLLGEETVTYLNHEAPDGHGSVISPDFLTFLTEWSDLMFPGPDYSYWECFLGGPNNYIESHTERAREWRRWLAGELQG